MVMIIAGDTCASLILRDIRHSACNSPSTIAQRPGPVGPSNPIVSMLAPWGRDPDFQAYALHATFYMSTVSARFAYLSTS